MISIFRNSLKYCSRQSRPQLARLFASGGEASEVKTTFPESKISHNPSGSETSDQVQGKNTSSQELSQVDLEIAVLHFHTKMKLLNKHENRFEPTSSYKLKQVNLSNDFATIGIKMDELDIYQIDNEKFSQRPDKSLNYFSASWLRIVFPLETNQSIRKYLVKVEQKGVRIGRLLEIMDIMAGRVCYLHCGSRHESKDFTIVTASVDGIQFFHDVLDIDKNITLDVS